MSPERKRAAVKRLQEKFTVSERRACNVLDQPRSSQRYETSIRDDEATLVKQILELVGEFPRYGYRFITAKLRQLGWLINPKRVYRIWKQEGLKIPMKKRKKRRLGTSENACHRKRAKHKNDVWSWDFIFDRTVFGKQLKWLTIVDEYTRENLCLEVDYGMTSEEVITILAELFRTRGLPQHVRSDNGPEFIAEAIKEWFGKLDILTLYIEPGSPWENGYAESFNSRFRDEFLALEVFDNLPAAKRLTTSYRRNYNEDRPHSSLGYQTPSQFGAGLAASAPALAGPALQRQDQLPGFETESINQLVLS